LPIHEDQRALANDIWGSGYVDQSAVIRDSILNDAAKFNMHAFLDMHRIPCKLKLVPIKRHSPNPTVSNEDQVPRIENPTSDRVRQQGPAFACLWKKELEFARARPR
jgi:hypothetical protein